MRAPVVGLLVASAAIVASARSAAARPTVAIAGIEVAGDSVGVDVEAVGIARELTQGLRRQADRPDSPLQLIDPMIRADDVEALLWGKLIRDGDTWVATLHLSAVGSDGDTVSYRALIAKNQTSSIELGRWAKIIYDSLLDQIDVDDKDDEPAPKAATPTPAVAGAPSPPAAAGGVDPFAVREPPTHRHHPFEVATADDQPGAAVDLDAHAAALVDTTPQFRKDRPPRPEARANQSARRLFWISAGVAGAGALLWGYSAFRVSDAEDQIRRLQGCINCGLAIEAANTQGHRWEGISWLAGTATVAGAAAALLFGYQGFIVGKKPAPSELVGSRARRGRMLSVAPVVTPDRIGAGMTLSF